MSKKQLIFKYDMIWLLRQWLESVEILDYSKVIAKVFDKSHSAFNGLLLKSNDSKKLCLENIFLMRKKCLESFETPWKPFLVLVFISDSQYLDRFVSASKVLDIFIRISDSKSIFS